MDPCGTPNKISSQELQLALFFVLCCLLNRQLQISFNADKLKLYAFNLARSSLWGRQSKAFDRSINKAPKDFPLSTALFHFSINAMRHCCVLYHFLKPHWNLKKYLFMKVAICLYIIFSNTGVDKFLSRRPIFWARNFTCAPDRARKNGCS